MAADVSIEQFHKLRRSGRHEQAAQVARDALSRWPDNPDLVAAAAYVFGYGYRHEAGLRLAEQAVAIDPGNPSAQAARVDFLRRSRRYLEAEAAAAEGLRAHPDNPDVLVAAARLAGQAGRNYEAMGMVERAVAVAPGHLSARTARIDVLRWFGRYQQSLATAEHAARDQPDDPDLLLTASWSASDLGRYADALAWADRALTIDPGHEEALTVRAAFLLADGRHEEGGEALLYAAHERPDSPDVLVVLGWYASGLGRYEEAVEWADRALTIDSRHVGALIARISFLRFAGCHNDAEEAVTRSLEWYSDDPDVLLAVGRHCSARDRDEEAMGWAGRAVAIDPRHVGALVAQIDYMRFTGCHDDAEEAVTRALELYPEEADLLLAGARLHSVCNRDDEAVEWADRALVADPRHEEALVARINFLRFAGRNDDADIAAAQAAERYPKDPDVLVAVGRHHSALDRDNDAVGWAEQALAVDPFHLGALTARVEFLHWSERNQEGEEAIRQAVLLHPTDSDLLCAAGWFEAGRDRFGAAIEWADRALTAEPTHVGALAARIDFLRWARQFEAAEEAAQQAVELRPNDINVLLAVSNCHSDLGRYDEALSWIDRALGIEPGHATSLAARIDLFRVAGRYEEAEQAVLDALEQRGDGPDIYVAAGWLASALDRYDEAVSWVDRALAVAPRQFDALVARIQFLRAAGHKAEADEAARLAADRRLDDPDVFIAVGRHCSALDRDDEAVEWADKALAIDPHHISALIARIDFLRWARRYEEAEEAVATAVGSRPDDAGIRLAVGRHCSALDRDDEAVEWADRALAIDPHHVSALIARIDFLRWARRYEEAQEAVAQALDRYPGNPDVLIAVARLFSSCDDEDQAVVWADRALAIDARHLNALTERIEFLRWAKKYEEAEAAIQTAVQRRPASVGPHIAAARLSSDRRRFQQALQRIGKALAIEPANADALTLEIWLLRQLRQHDKAQRRAEQALLMLPSEPDIHYAVGLTQAAQLLFDEALESFARGLKIDPRNVQILTARSLTLRSMHRYAQAEREILAARAVNPINRDLRVELGWIHHDQGRPADAKRLFEALFSTAIAKDERSLAALGLGWGAFKQGAYARAEGHFRRAVEVNPQDDDSRLSLAWSIVRQDHPRRWEEAQRLAAEVNDESESPAAHICLGVLAFKSGDLPSAEFHLRRALEVDAFNGSLTDLGALYAQMNRVDEATNTLKEALERDWYDVAAHTELGALKLSGPEDQLPEAELQFRQALAIEPGAGTAAIGLAQVLERAGDDADAELCLRQCLNTPSVQARWRVELALARVLIARGDKQQNIDIFADAYQHAQKAIDQASDSEADPHYVAGVAHHRMGTLAIGAAANHDFRRRSMRHLKECLARDAGHIEAQRSLLLLERESKLTIPAIRGGYALAVVSILMLALVWVTFFFSTKITGVVLASITPVLIGLFAISLLLPALIRLKMPGFEADLQAGTSNLSPGPTGEVAFGPNRSAVSTGPSGNLAAGNGSLSHPDRGQPPGRR